MRGLGKGVDNIICCVWNPAWRGGQVGSQEDELIRGQPDPEPGGGQWGQHPQQATALSWAELG